ncbi:hypothetical protein L596_020006 [Steinernema carpocapsae]|uniref:Uncharacterized protein n=1 Tax=Steinernema carpocapsae TaxID=34508 RepID=A0A4U5MT29_STECR|nr:hypothetical protein L596_020006 [Steinernema carpocapsae]
MNRTQDMELIESGQEEDRVDVCCLFCTCCCECINGAAGNVLIAVMVFIIIAVTAIYYVLMLTGRFS